jgi:hypothetical protein
MCQKFARQVIYQIYQVLYRRVQYCLLTHKCACFNFHDLVAMVTTSFAKWLAVARLR